MKLEDQLIFLNQKKRMSLAEIAASVGCSERTLNNIKTTGKGRPATIAAIVKLYQKRLLRSGQTAEEAPIEYGETVDLLGAPWDLWLSRLTKRQGFNDPMAYLRHLLGQEHEAAFPDWPDVPGVAQRIEICGQDSTADRQDKNFPET